MSGAPHTDRKKAPSVRPEGVTQAKRLHLKAANDNRAPLSYRIRKLAMIILPLTMLAFFAAVWYFRGG